MNKNTLVITMIKEIILIIGIAIFIIYALPLVAGILNIGNLFGMGVGAVFICISRFYAPIMELVSALCEKKVGKAILIAILALIIACIGVFACTLASVVKESKNSANGQTTVITLGCRVRGDVPSLQLQSRCNETIKYLENNPDAVAILSGGQGADENISEAQCMFNLITEAGIDANRLYIEDKSTSTDENIKFSKRIIEDNKLDDNVVIVTSEYHLKRAKMICKRHNLNAEGIPAHSSYYSLPTFYTREVFGVWAQWIK